MSCHGTLNEIRYIGDVGDGVIVIKDIRVKVEFFEDGGEVSVFELGGESSRLERLINNLCEDWE